MVVTRGKNVRSAVGVCVLGAARTQTALAPELKKLQGTWTLIETSVQAERDTGYYPTGVKVTDAEPAAVPLTGHRFHPEWNYTIGPGPKNPKPVVTR